MLDPLDPDPADPATGAAEDAEPGDARDSDAWAHVDPDHPRPWDGCIRRGLCCRQSPGWFAPGEAERAAAHLGLEVGELVNRHLVLDAVETTVGKIEGFTPVKLGRDGLPVEPAGQRVSQAYGVWQGQCSFFDGNGCSIYPVRPLECRLYDCTALPEDNPARLDLALLWLGAWRHGQSSADENPFTRPIADVIELRTLASRARAEFQRRGSGER